MRKPIGNKLRFKVLERDKFRCQYCGATANEERLQIDHILSVFNGGKNDISNLITACYPCNIGKHKRLTEYQAPLKINILEILTTKIKEETQPVYDMYSSYFPNWRISDDYRNVISKFINKFGIANVLSKLENSCKNNKDFHDAYINFIWQMPEIQ